MTRFVALILLAACGRIGFDPLDDGGGDGTSDSKIGDGLCGKYTLRAGTNP